jgi:hypothetical protein
MHGVISVAGWLPGERVTLNVPDMHQAAPPGPESV